ncbi:MAG: tRNA (adenosine(37)-N6)-threonylcarbamoyltransferase complex transferase subunit TsaD [Nitrospinota bacterium]|nr:tRNA (adenosine(37)-N6)-threonylcarbamoyltransferase complex transferase subunit TsaD [Nitrospinota bacterium]
MLILGIETSCDETAAAVVKDGNEVLSNIISSQVDIHSKYGGIVPELACRNHIENLPVVIRKVMDEAKLGMSDLDGLAVTVGPGLIGALLIGVNTAKGIAYSLNKPLIPVNHLEGHMLSIFLEKKSPEFPFIALIISGGHTDLYFVRDFTDYSVLGRTRDDAVGESFDKVARMLGLGYPGGPIIERIARDGTSGDIKFPRPMLVKGNFDFSFSGLKTSVRNFLANNGKGVNKTDIAAEFQAAVLDILSFKVFQAAEISGCGNIVVAGGVAANNFLRENLIRAAEEKKMTIYFPKHNLCTDNAAMIACAGFYRYIKKANEQNRFMDYLALDACANLKL